MKNDFAIKYASRLDKEYRKGFTFGLGIVLLGYYNTVDEFIEDEEKQGEFFQLQTQSLLRGERRNEKGNT